MSAVTNLALMLAIFVLGLDFVPTSAEVTYEDLRCKCTCASYHSLPAKVYKRNTLHDDCNCLSVVLPRLNGTFVKEHDIDAYCYLCECKYEVRSTKTMQVVVFIFLIVVGLLVSYMIFTMISDLVMKACGHVFGKTSHQQLPEQVTELSESTAGTRDADRGSIHSGRSRSTSQSVLQRVNHAQAKWKRQVQEQQTNVFEKQELLN